MNISTGDLADIINDDLPADVAGINDDPPKEPEPAPAPKAADPAPAPKPEPTPAPLEEEPIISADAPIGVIIDPVPDPAPAPAPGDPAPAPADIVKYTLEEIFPGMDYKDLDQVQKAKVVEAIQGRTKLSGDIELLTTKNTELTEKLSTKLNPYANSDIAELNAFTRETGNYNPNLFNKLKSADLEAMDPVDVMVLKLEANNSSGVSSDELKRHIKIKYNLLEKDFSGEVDEDEKLRKVNANREEIKNNLVGLRIESDAARQEMIELKSKIKTVDLQEQQNALISSTQEARKTAAQEWLPHVDSSINGLRQYPVEYTIGEKAMKVDFEIPAEKLEFYKQQATTFAVNSGIKPDAEGQKVIGGIIESYIRSDFHNQMVSKAVNAALSTKGEKLEEEFNNPSGDKLPPNPSQTIPEPTPKTSEDFESDAFEATMSHLSEMGGGHEG